MSHPRVAFLVATLNRRADVLETLDAIERY